MRKLQRALITTVLEAAGNGSAKACWALMREAKAENFSSAIDVSKAAPRQVVTLRKSKKADRYWSASPGAKPPVIPVAKIGYVRRAEVNRHRYKVEINVPPRRRWHRRSERE